MDLEVIPGPVKFVIGCWTRHGRTSVYTKEKMSRWPWSSMPQKAYFKVYIIRWHAQRVLWWERQKTCSSRKRQGPWQTNDVILISQRNLVWGREYEIKRRQENGQTSILFLKLPFSSIYIYNYNNNNNNILTCRCKVIPVGPHSVYT